MPTNNAKSTTTKPSGTDASNKASTPKPVSQRARKAAEAKAAEAATLAAANNAAKVSKVLPSVPDGWTPGYSPNGFVRYARRLRANGQPITAYRMSAAKGKDEIAQRDALRIKHPQGEFVVINHTTDQSAAFDAWNDAYAYSMALANTSLAKSVVASIGKDGLAALTTIVGQEVSERTTPATAVEEPAKDTAKK